jgi:hypothetical protein
MSLQGPLVIVAETAPDGLGELLSAEGAFPIVDATPADAPAAIGAAKPGAILLADAAACADASLAQWLAENITPLAPIVPVLAYASEDQDIAYREALPVSTKAKSPFLAARLSAVARARTLHSTVLRRAGAQDDGHALPDVPQNDPLDDATVIVAGRGKAYPELSVAIAEHAGVLGTLSIEAAARYLKARDTDGLVFGDGFSPRNVEAFLIAVSEDVRFRDLPVGVLGNVPPLPDVEYPNIVAAAEPARLAARVLPFIRLHAFEERLRRTLESFDKNGILDPATGLLREAVFVREFERAISDAQERSTGMSIARFTFDAGLGTRAEMDAARLVSRMVRNVDFGYHDDDGSVLVVFTETDLRQAHVIARRIASVLKHTMLAPGQKREAAAPAVTLATRKSGDTVASLLARVTAPAIAAE